MIRAVVTDIEGTTSSLSFVKDVLFPYAKEHMAEFVRANQHTGAVAEQLSDMKKYSDARGIEEQISQLLQWIAEDQKITPLKTLQGLIWEKGYADKDFFGHIYKDAYQVLKQWHNDGIALYVYSSGSVYAQKLLYGHTDFGDITYLFSGYFDTKIGAKAEVQSYETILSQINLAANEVVFLSDIEQELDAAKAAGMGTYWLVRQGELNNACSHTQVSNFKEIHL